LGYRLSLSAADENAWCSFVTLLEAGQKTSLRGYSGLMELDRQIEILRNQGDYPELFRLVRQHASQHAEKLSQQLLSTHAGLGLAATDIALLAVEPERDIELLESWLSEPGVQRWWGNPERARERIFELPPKQQSLIAVAKKASSMGWSASGAWQPVGYLRWTGVDRDALDEAGLHEIPDDAVDADILVGEPDWRGKGVGVVALRAMVARLRRAARYSVVGLCTSITNERAQRAFYKAGFVKLRQFDDPALGRMWVMLAELET
jgi:RimJ/RimL family protein N-acetyltransferase